MYGRDPRTNWFRVLLIHYVDSVSAAIARGKRPVTFRTRKLRLSAPMVLQGGPCGRVGHRRTSFECGRSTQCWVGLSCFPGRCACVRVWAVWAFLWVCCVTWAWVVLVVCCGVGVVLWAAPFFCVLLCGRAVPGWPLLWSGVGGLSGGALATGGYSRLRHENPPVVVVKHVDVLAA